MRREDAVPIPGNSSRQAEYHNSCVSEGNTVAEMEGWTGDVDHWFELGRAIGIIRRVYTRSGGSPVIIIVLSNLRGILKSKDKLINRWCCCEAPNLYQGRRRNHGSSRSEDILKGCDGGITPSCQVFWGSKDFGAWKWPQLGINPQALKLLC